MIPTGSQWAKRIFKDFSNIVIPSGGCLSAFPVFCEFNIRILKVQPIPKLTRYGLVFLIQPFAIIGIFANADGLAFPQKNFCKPIRVGQSLSGQPNDISLIL